MCIASAIDCRDRGKISFRGARNFMHARHAAGQDTLSTLSSWGLLAAPMPQPPHSAFIRRLTAGCICTERFFTLSGFCQSYSKLTGPKADCGPACIYIFTCILMYNVYRCICEIACTYFIYIYIYISLSLSSVPSRGYKTCPWSDFVP